MSNKIEEQLEAIVMVKARIRQEGFHYCFVNYSSFEDVEDEEFHKLRKQYLASAKALEEHVDKRIDELESQSLEQNFDDLID